MKTNPVGGAEDPALKSIRQIKKPIRDVIGLPGDIDDATLKEYAISLVFISGYLMNLFGENRNGIHEISMEHIIDETVRRAEELISRDHKYTLKNIDEDVENAKQKLGLAREASKGEVYFQQTVNNIKGILRSIIGVDYKIPENISSYSKFEEEMSNAVWTALKKRFTGSSTESIEEYFFNINLCSVITQIHG